VRVVAARSEDGSDAIPVELGVDEQDVASLRTGDDKVTPSGRICSVPVERDAPVGPQRVHVVEEVGQQGGIGPPGPYDPGAFFDCYKGVVLRRLVPPFDAT
jgi:hypothetical protein